MLNIMKEKGLKCNIENYLFGQTEMEYLGFWVTRDGFKPINEKIEVITDMALPIYRKEVRKFIGVIKYYCNMWPRQSHTSAPLTILSLLIENWNGRKSNKMLLTKLGRLWTDIIY